LGQPETAALCVGCGSETVGLSWQRFHNRNIKQGYIALSLNALQGEFPLTPVGLFLSVSAGKKSPQTTGKKMTAEKRTKQLIIRVSPTEFETLTRQKTHPNLARYIRERVLEDGKASDKKTVKFQFPPEVVRVLAGMGNNLNQIAKTLNTAAKVGTLNSELDDLKQQRAEAERTLDLLNTKTKGLTLENCPVENSKATRVCVATDPSSPPYYANNDKTRAWRYIAQKNSR
jgi:hypothetical protein